MLPQSEVSVDLRRIFNRLSIGTVGVAATQINVLINTLLATSTVLGAVSWLNYAFRLFQFPVGILGVSIAGSNLVHFSSAIKENNLPLAKSYLSESLKLAFLTIIPSMALLMAMAEPSVRLIFERGLFEVREVSYSNNWACSKKC